MIRFGRAITNDPLAASTREWLVTNGLGSYALGTLSGVRTQRYHGLLIAALQPPTARTLLVAGVEAWLQLDNAQYPLFSHQWDPDLIEPQGYLHLEAFYLDGTLPVWLWSVNDVQIEQRVWMVYGQDITYITYRLLRGTRPVRLALTPLCTYRDHHGNTTGNKPISVYSKPSKAATIPTCLCVQAECDLSQAHPLSDSISNAPIPYYLWSNGSAEMVERWYGPFHLAMEEERGLPSDEELFAVATLTHELAVGDTALLVCTTGVQPPPTWPVALQERQTYERALLTQANWPNAPWWIQQLTLAADQFIVQRDIGGQTGRSILAGFPWFADWGRDTMIALHGLTLAVGRPAIASDILRTFAHFVSDGMLPNRFPDHGQTPEYNTVDATLWYFEAVRAYLAVHDDPDLLRALYPILQDIVAWHIRGTRYHIHMDQADGLLYAGEAGVQLTWMDVKIKDWVVTPRHGKPVEINALWYNALCCMAAFAIQLDDTSAADVYSAMAHRAKYSFNQKFWYAAGGYLYDVVNTPHTANGVDASLRPNQLIAIALHYSPVELQLARAVVDVCARELVTSYGLRSLSYRDEHYIGQYTGDLVARDSAYHQGTVWSWLMGAFVQAHFKVYGDTHAALSYLSAFQDHLLEAGLGTISEVFEGNAPHRPKACLAQAWGVAEVLRLYRQLT